MSENIPLLYHDSSPEQHDNISSIEHAIASISAACSADFRRCLECNDEEIVPILHYFFEFFELIFT